MRRKMLDSTIHSTFSGKLFKGQVAKKLRELLEIRNLCYLYRAYWELLQLNPVLQPASTQSNNNI